MNIIDDILRDRLSSNQPLYSSRLDAANKMIEFISAYHLYFDKLVYIPMGGKPIRDVLITKFSDLHNLMGLACPVVKISCELNEKFGIGALDVFGEPLLNNSAIDAFKASTIDVKNAIDRARKKQNSLIQSLKTNKDSYHEIANANVLIVDDGLSSGYSMLAAVNSLLRLTNVTNLCCLVPVASIEGIRLIRTTFHNIDIFSLFYDNSSVFFVDSFYDNFEDIEVKI